MAVSPWRITVSLPHELGVAVEKCASELWSSPAQFCRHAVVAAVATRQAAQAGYLQLTRRGRGKSSDEEFGGEDAAA
jgi:hypothetical protein